MRDYIISVKSRRSTLSHKTPPSSLRVPLKITNNFSRNNSYRPVMSSVKSRPYITPTINQTELASASLTLLLSLSLWSFYNIYQQRCYKHQQFLITFIIIVIISISNIWSLLCQTRPSLCSWSLFTLSFSPVNLSSWYSTPHFRSASSSFFTYDFHRRSYDANPHRLYSYWHWQRNVPWNISRMID